MGIRGASPAEPSGYEGELLCCPIGLTSFAHAFVLGKRKEPGLTVDDIIRRGIRIMERMQEKAFYENSTAFMREDSHFTGCTDEELLRLRDRISQWIGQAIDQRAVLGWAMDPLFAQAEPSARTGSPECGKRFVLDHP